MNTQKQAPQHAYTGHEEHILVVKRTDLFPNNSAFQGLQKFESQSWIERILDKKEFLPRSLMETDFNYKQIIPYLVFTHGNKLFLMQRQAKASETRLQSKFSLGIGGHIREEDIEDADIAGWARREFHEEVVYNDSFSVEPLGILNDDSNDVGKVHVGFVYLLKGDSENIAVQEELKSGMLLTIEECDAFYDRMESWSQIVFDWIKKNQVI